MFARFSLALLLVFLTAGAGIAQDIFDAARSGDLKKIRQYAASNKESVTAVNSQGFTPLMIACYRDQSKAAKLLVELGADVNAASPEGSALQAAVYKGNRELAAFLLEKGAFADAKGPDGNTALMLAVLAQDEKLVRLLVKHGADLRLRNSDGQTAYSLALTQENEQIRELTKFGDL